MVHILGNKALGTENKTTWCFIKGATTNYNQIK